MVAYRSDDWKDGSEGELTADEQRELKIALAIGLGFTGLLVFTVYLIAITLDAFDNGVFAELPTNIY